MSKISQQLFGYIKLYMKNILSFGEINPTVYIIKMFLLESVQDRDQFLFPKCSKWTVRFFVLQRLYNYLWSLISKLIYFLSSTPILQYLHLTHKGFFWQHHKNVSLVYVSDVFNTVTRKAWFTHQYCYTKTYDKYSLSLCQTVSFSLFLYIYMYIYTKQARSQSGESVEYTDCISAEE